VFLGGLFVLAMLAACYVAAEIILPIVLAFVLSLVLTPAMRVLERAHLPRAVAAILAILVLFGTLGGLGTVLSVPAASWAQKLPSGIPKLEERLSFLSRPIAAFQKVIDQAQGLTQGGEPKAVPVAVQGSGLSYQLLSGTRSFASGLLETVLVLFFLLVSGDTFLRRLVEILPRFQDKRQAVDISKQIESDVSAYLFTITIMNLAVGVATGAVMAVCGVGDPVLWGTIAFLLNYIPILGPMLGVVVFLLAGPFVDRLAMDGISAGRAVPAHPSHRRRNGDANAARPALHDQPGSGHPLAGVLVLDVGRTRGDFLNPDAGDHQDHQRSYPSADGVRSFHGRVVADGGSPARETSRSNPRRRCRGI
jgi:predicted PurR-regulated permease PerM